MNKTILSVTVLIVQMFLVGGINLSAQQREIAVTIDNLPLNGPQF